MQGGYVREGGGLAAVRRGVAGVVLPSDVGELEALCGGVAQLTRKVEEVTQALEFEAAATAAPAQTQPDALAAAVETLQAHGFTIAPAADVQPLPASVTREQGYRWKKRGSAPPPKATAAPEPSANKNHIEVDAVYRWRPHPTAARELRRRRWRNALKRTGFADGLIGYLGMARTKAAVAALLNVETLWDLVNRVQSSKQLPRTLPKVTRRMVGTLRWRCLTEHMVSPWRRFALVWKMHWHFRHYIRHPVFLGRPQRTRSQSSWSSSSSRSSRSRTSDEISDHFDASGLQSSDVGDFIDRFESFATTQSAATASVVSFDPYEHAPAKRGGAAIPRQLRSGASPKRTVRPVNSAVMRSTSTVSSYRTPSSAQKSQFDGALSEDLPRMQKTHSTMSHGTVSSVASFRSEPSRRSRRRDRDGRGGLRGVAEGGAVLNAAQVQQLVRDLAVSSDSLRHLLTAVLSEAFPAADEPPAAKPAPAAPSVSEGGAAAPASPSTLVTTTLHPTTPSTSNLAPRVRRSPRVAALEPQLLDRQASTRSLQQQMDVSPMIGTPHLATPLPATVSGAPEPADAWNPGVVTPVAPGRDKGREWAWHEKTTREWLQKALGALQHNAAAMSALEQYKTVQALAAQLRDLSEELSSNASLSSRSRSGSSNRSRSGSAATRARSRSRVAGTPQTQLSGRRRRSVSSSSSGPTRRNVARVASRDSRPSARASLRSRSRSRSRSWSSRSYSSSRSRSSTRSRTPSTPRSSFHSSSTPTHHADSEASLRSSDVLRHDPGRRPPEPSYLPEHLWGVMPVDPGGFLGPTAAYAILPLQVSDDDAAAVGAPLDPDAGAAAAAPSPGGEEGVVSCASEPLTSEDGDSAAAEQEAFRRRTRRNKQRRLARAAWELAGVHREYDSDAGEETLLVLDPPKRVPWQKKNKRYAWMRDSGDGDSAEAPGEDDASNVGRWKTGRIVESPSTGGTSTEAPFAGVEGDEQKKAPLVGREDAAQPTPHTGVAQGTIGTPSWAWQQDGDTTGDSINMSSTTTGDYLIDGAGPVPAHGALTPPEVTPIRRVVDDGASPEAEAWQRWVEQGATPRSSVSPVDASPTPTRERASECSPDGGTDGSAPSLLARRTVNAVKKPAPLSPAFALPGEAAQASPQLDGYGVPVSATTAARVASLMQKLSSISSRGLLEEAECAGLSALFSEQQPAAAACTLGAEDMLRVLRKLAHCAEQGLLDPPEYATLTTKLVGSVGVGADRPPSAPPEPPSPGPEPQPQLQPTATASSAATPAAAKLSDSGSVVITSAAHSRSLGSAMHPGGAPPGAWGSEATPLSTVWGDELRESSAGGSMPSTLHVSAQQFAAFAHESAPGRYAGDDDESVSRESSTVPSVVQSPDAGAAMPAPHSMQGARRLGLHVSREGSQGARKEEEEEDESAPPAIDLTALEGDAADADTFTLRQLLPTVAVEEHHEAAIAAAVAVAAAAGALDSTFSVDLLAADLERQAMRDAQAAILKDLQRVYEDPQMPSAEDDADRRKDSRPASPASSLRSDPFDRLEQRLLTLDDKSYSSGDFEAERADEYAGFTRAGAAYLDDTHDGDGHLSSRSSEWDSSAYDSSLDSLSAPPRRATRRVATFCTGRAAERRLQERCFVLWARWATDPTLRADTVVRRKETTHEEETGRDASVEAEQAAHTAPALRRREGQLPLPLPPQESAAPENLFSDADEADSSDDEAAAEPPASTPLAAAEGAAVPPAEGHPDDVTQQDSTTTEVPTPTPAFESRRTTASELPQAALSVPADSSLSADEADSSTENDGDEPPPALVHRSTHSGMLAMALRPGEDPLAVPLEDGTERPVFRAHADFGAAFGDDPPSSPAGSAAPRLTGIARGAEDVLGVQLSGSEASTTEAKRARRAPLPRGTPQDVLGVQLSGSEGSSTDAKRARRAPLPRGTPQDVLGVQLSGSEGSSTDAKRARRAPLPRGTQDVLGVQLSESEGSSTDAKRARRAPLPRGTQDVLGVQLSGSEGSSTDAKRPRRAAIGRGGDDVLGVNLSRSDGSDSASEPAPHVARQQPLARVKADAAEEQQSAHVTLSDAPARRTALPRGGVVDVLGVQLSGSEGSSTEVKRSRRAALPRGGAADLLGAQLSGSEGSSDVQPRAAGRTRRGAIERGAQDVLGVCLSGSDGDSTEADRRGRRSAIERGAEDMLGTLAGSEGTSSYADDFDSPQPSELAVGGGRGYVKPSRYDTHSSASRERSPGRLAGRIHSPSADSAREWGQDMARRMLVWGDVAIPSATQLQMMTGSDPGTDASLHSKVSSETDHTPPLRDDETSSEYGDDFEDDDSDAF